MDVFKLFIFVVLFVLTAVVLARLYNYKSTTTNRSGEIDSTKDTIRSKFSGWLSKCFKFIREKGAISLGFGLFFSTVYKLVRNFLRTIFKGNKRSQRGSESKVFTDGEDKQEDNTVYFNQCRSDYRSCRDRLISDISQLGGKDADPN